MGSTSGSGQDRYLLSNDEDIAAEYDKNLGLATSYSHGPGIDEPLAQLDRSSSEVNYFHGDALGSVVASTGSEGIQTGHSSYRSFGPAVSTIGKQSRFGYSGREGHDSEFLYYRARYYDPQQGTFHGEDPYPKDLHRPATINAYSYALNNPVVNVDPFGLFSIQPSYPLIGAPTIVVGPHFSPSHHDYKRQQIWYCMGPNAIGILEDFLAITASLWGAGFLGYLTYVIIAVGIAELFTLAVTASSALVTALAVVAGIIMVAMALIALIAGAGVLYATIDMIFDMVNHIFEVCWGPELTGITFGVTWGEGTGYWKTYRDRY